MGFFKRNHPDDPTATLLLQGKDMIEKTAAAHHADWGLGTADRWDADLVAGTIAWTFPDHTAVAPVQILGSHNTGHGAWAWAWALESVPPALRLDAEKARAYGERTSTALLTSPHIPVDESGAADLAAMAFRVCEATGFYRGPGASTTFFTFGPVTVTAADGTSRTFRIRTET